MKKKWFKTLLMRRMLEFLLLAVQLALLIFVIISRNQISEILNIVLYILGIFVAIWVLTKNTKGGYKQTWVFLILLAPIFGATFYFLFTNQVMTKKFGKKIAMIERKTKSIFCLPMPAKEDAQIKTKDGFPLVSYLQDYTGYPVYNQSEAKYLSPGETFWERLLEELEKAERYIFMEYFIIEEGKMWNSILDILKRKAQEGMLVRVLFDDIGCFLRVPSDYVKRLRKDGIECYVFNPFRPFLSSKQNNRDHRKITSIDGEIAFTGGANLADEYINEINKFGRWKDAAVVVKGKAAWSFTVMFLQMWEFASGKGEDYNKYYPYLEKPCDITGDGFIQPYADNPMDKENIGEHVYRHIISNAEKYLYINTPYLILDDSIISELTLAAKSGVDVRIVTPHRWDKRIVHFMTRSYYKELLLAGVRIYEYTDGFMHSKTFVSDDKIATVGTVNLDYRSLYLHFECGAVFYNNAVVGQVKDDFLETLKTCQAVTINDCKANVLLRMFQALLRLFAPLM